MSRDKVKPATLSPEQLAAVLSTFAPPKRLKRAAVPHVILVDGVRVAMTSGKYVWPSHGAAAGALTNHVDRLLWDATYSTATRGAAFLCLTLPPEDGQPRSYRRAVAKGKEIAAALLASGRVQIVPAGTPPPNTAIVDREALRMRLVALLRCDNATADRVIDDLAPVSPCASSPR